MDSNSIDSAKSSMRTRVRERLRGMDSHARAEASQHACERLAADSRFTGATSVMLYMPLRSELDVTPLAQVALRQGKRVSVPRTNSEHGTLTAVGIASIDDGSMPEDTMGVRTPASGPEVAPESLDLVVVPGVAFDRAGHRLGRGAGYYDRFLSRLSPRTATAGICFDEQLVDAVPHGDHDRTVDCVFTPSRTISASRTSNT
jgi:5-formyltetrahydrofolate cyclo-ligase